MTDGDAEALTWFCFRIERTYTWKPRLKPRFRNFAILTSFYAHNFFRWIQVCERLLKLLKNDTISLYLSRFRAGRENLDRGQSRFQPIKSFNLVVSSLFGERPHNNAMYLLTDAPRPQAKYFPVRPGQTQSIRMLSYDHFENFVSTWTL